MPLLPLGGAGRTLLALWRNMCYLLRKGVTMINLVRFGVSIEADLLRGFDRFNRQKGFVNRSQGLRDVLRSLLDEDRVQDDSTASLGVLTLVYDHHKRDLEDRLTTIQHDHHHSHYHNHSRSH